VAAPAFDLEVPSFAAVMPNFDAQATQTRWLDWTGDRAERCSALSEDTLTVSRERRGYAQEIAPAAGLDIATCGRLHDPAGRRKRRRNPI
jgi:hypothetical protein